MTEVFQLPPAAEEVHRAISQKATVLLGGMVDGNGLKAAQVRLARQETQIYPIPAFITVTLKPEIAKTQLRGRSPQGEVLDSDATVMSQSAGLSQGFLEGTGLQQEILQILQKTPGEGFGMEPMALAVKSARKEFSVLTTCLKCNGLASIPCALCQTTGKTPCQTCRGQGFSPCPICFGQGIVQDAGGNRVSCMRCQHTGKIVCVTCNGQQQLTCTVCNGRGSTACVECGQSGSLTHVYQVSYKALCQLEIDWRAVAPEIRKIAETLGIRQMTAKGHAEIYWRPPEMEKDHLLIPCVAFLPVAAVEFSVEGKTYPAMVAGLQGRILQIDPLLDAAVKPGISALQKLSKGPMAVQALVDTACRYRLVRQVIAGLTRYSKRAVYQTLVRDYPVILSDKYARATIHYASKAVLAISAGPRYKGLVAGTVLAALLAAGYYMTHLRSFILTRMEGRNAAQHIILLDIVVWILGYVIAVFTIKFMTAAAFKRMLPQSMQMDKGGLPSAGMQGFAALLTSGLVWFVVAAFAADKPAWVIHF